MGNRANKSSKNFFDELKETTAYRDFVIRINQMISRGNVDWTLNLNKISIEELNIYNDQIINFYCFVSDYLYEHSVKKEMNDKQGFLMMRKLISVITKLSVYLAIHKPFELYDILWSTLNYETKLEANKSPNNYIEKLKIDGKDYIGAEDQLTNGLKLIIASVKLCFANGFGVKYNTKKTEILKTLIYQEGWLDSQASKTVVENRIALLEFLTTLMFIEKKFNIINEKHNNAVIYFISHHVTGGILFKSLVMTGVTFQENGLIPYSGYFLRQYWELALYSAALGLNLALFLLKEPLITDIQEWKNPRAHLQLQLINVYLNNYGLLKSDVLDEFFEDNNTISECLNHIAGHLASFYEKDNTLLPFSYKQSPFIEEMIFLFLALINKSDVAVAQLTKLKGDINIVMPLIIILDQIPQSFNNGVYYAVLSCLLKLSSCKLTSRYILSKTQRRKPL